MHEHLDNLQCHPLTEARWADFETLFGPKGACGGCWCMLWRMTRSEFERNKGDANRRKMAALVASGESPGLLAYGDNHQGRPVALGWCALGPREHYPALQRSRILQPVDDQPVWSVTCLFVSKEYRRRGVSVQLLRAAQTHARCHGAKILEGYPIEPRQPAMPDAFAWTGLAAAFLEAGFSECLRRSETRPIMRVSLTRPGKRHKR